MDKLKIKIPRERLVNQYLLYKELVKVKDTGLSYELNKRLFVFKKAQTELEEELTQLKETYKDQAVTVIKERETDKYLRDKKENEKLSENEYEDQVLRGKVNESFVADGNKILKEQVELEIPILKEEKITKCFEEGKFDGLDISDYFALNEYLIEYF